MVDKRKYTLLSIIHYHLSGDAPSRPCAEWAALTGLRGRGGGGGGGEGGGRGVGGGGRATAATTKEDMKLGG